MGWISPGGSSARQFTSAEERGNFPDARAHLLGRRIGKKVSEYFFVAQLLECMPGVSPKSTPWTALSLFVWLSVGDLQIGKAEQGQINRAE